MSIDMGQADRTLRHTPASPDDGVFDRHRERMERMNVEELWEAQVREWPGSVRMSVQDVFQWCDRAESVKHRLHRYVQVAMALQYPAVVFYHLENPKYRGFRYGVEGHEYMSILEV